MKFFRRCIIGFRRFGFIGERAEEFLPAVFFDVHDPLFAAAVPGNAFIFRCGCSGGAAVDVILPDGAVAKVGAAIVQAVVIDVVTDKMLGRFGNQPVHKNSPGFTGHGDSSHGINSFDITLAVPAKLRQPYVIFGIDFRVSAPGERDFAVIAEFISVNRQLVFRPVVGTDMFRLPVAKTAAYIFAFDDGPAGQAGLRNNRGRIFNAMQQILNSARIVAIAALSFSRRLRHSIILSTGGQKTTAPIMGATCADVTKIPTFLT